MKVKEKGCIRNSIYESLILYTSGCVYTIRDNVLKDILSKNMAEVTDMLLTEFDEKAYIEGVKKQSYEEGEAIGEARGKAKGEAIGEARGKAKGEDKLARLVVELKKRGRVEDIAKVTDESERERLYGEFNI